MVAVCRLCMSAVEAYEHLFLNCNYACSLWSTIGGVFDCVVPKGYGSISDMFHFCFDLPCSLDSSTLNIVYYLCFLGYLVC